jgi:hypothetical protein
MSKIKLNVAYYEQMEAIRKTLPAELKTDPLVQMFTLNARMLLDCFAPQDVKTKKRDFDLLGTFMDKIVSTAEEAESRAYKAESKVDEVRRTYVLIGEEMGQIIDEQTKQKSKVLELQKNLEVCYALLETLKATNNIAGVNPPSVLVEDVLEQEANLAPEVEPNNPPEDLALEDIINKAKKIGKRK